MKRLGLPAGADVIRAWVNPCAWWGARLRAAVEGRGNEFVRGMARDRFNARGSSTSARSRCSSEPRRLAASGSYQ